MSGLSAPGKAIVLIGFMGAGKTTAATELARELGVGAIDSDGLLEERFGHSIAREFELHGEAAFRAAEEELVCELLARAGSGSVIALGGGSVLSARVRAALQAHLVVLLEVEEEEAWARAGAGGAGGSAAGASEGPGEPGRGSGGAGELERGSGGAGEPAAIPARPLAGDRDSFAALHAERRELYEGLADAFLPARSRGVAVRALEALRALAAAPAGTRLLWAQAASGEYPVLVGRGLLDAEVLAAGAWPLARAGSRAFCVSDERVAALYARRLGPVQELIEIVPGEQSKTLASAEVVWRALVAGGMTRADHLIALGGGVVGDLAGFCAATYQRGVRIVQVPTTLVAQVDSAYGGKTGVDLPEAKNYVGAYHQPAAVLVDPGTLTTLAPGELAAGYAEVLKTALIAGGELWRRVAAKESVDESMILACARTKLAVVAADERDAGRRQVLNLGHTVAHAIETVTGYARYRHGEAVGLGLLAALRLSGREELRAQVLELLRAQGLPVRLEGAGVEEVAAATARDKKRVGARAPFVLLAAPGDARIGCEVGAEELRAAIAELA